MHERAFGNPICFLNGIRVGNATIDASALTAPRNYALPDAAGTLMIAEQQMQNLVSLGLAKKAPAGFVVGSHAIGTGRFGVLVVDDAVYPATRGRLPSPITTNPVNCLVIGVFDDGDFCCAATGVWPVIDNSGRAFIAGSAAYLDFEGTASDSPASSAGVPSQYLGMTCSDSYDDGSGTYYVLVNITIGVPT